MADPQPQPPQDDPDPIVASYSVFLKPDLPQNQRLLVLQHPNVQDGGSRTPPPPTELRIKPRTGMVELDLPIDLSAAYDKDKGQRWGGVLARSVQAKAGGSLGLAGGFGIGAPPQRAGGGRGGAGGGSRLAALGDEDLAVDWNEAVRTDRVLRTQTLGGMATGPEQREARYMVGVFQGNTLHLTPATASVHLRPQLHHIDATAEAERTKPREGGAPGSGAAGAGGPGGGAGAGAGGKDAPARAIHMTIKSAGGDGDEVTTETMADRLRAVQTEGWRRMTYHGEDTDAAWAMYDETLVLRDNTSSGGDNTAQPEQEDNNNNSSNSKGKGKGKEPAASTDVPGPSAEALSRRFGGLRTDWGEEETLRAISGLRKDKDGVVVKVEPPAENKADAKAAETKKGKGGRAAGRKTARGKASTAMEID